MLSIALLLAAGQVGPPPLIRTNPVPRPEVTPFATVQTWTIAVDHTLGGGCFLVTNYEDGTVLRIGVDGTTGVGYIILGNAAWHTLEQGKDYRIEMRFDYEEPWLADAVGFRFPSGDEIYLRATFQHVDFLTQFMAKQTLEISYEGSRVALLNLRGSGAAGLELIRCQESRSGDPPDPFESPTRRSPADPFDL